MANRTHNKAKNSRNGRHSNRLTSTKSSTYKKVDNTSNDAIISDIENWCRSQDMVHVQIYRQFKNKKFVENVSELLVENLLPTNIRRPVNIDIWVYNSLDEQAGGFCWGDKNTIEIELARTSEGHKFTREEMLINLTHELIHAKQFISGELSSTTARWKKADYSKTPYSKQPWEREAYYWEKRLYEKYFEKLNA